MPCVASSAPCAARLGAAPVRRAGGSRRVAAPRRSLAPAARAAVRAPPPPASSASSPSGIDALLAQLSAGLQPLLSSVTAATSGGGGAAAREAAKAELLDAIAGLNRGVAGLNRGVNATDADRAAVDAAARKLERLNPNRGSLASAAINGRWELIYTTSVSILGSNRPPFLRPQGPIYQTIDAGRLRAKNQETFPFFSSVTAELTPTSKSAVNVQFKTFRLLGFIPVTAPAAAKGSLDITYVDEELRVSRGNKENLFVLRQTDAAARLPDAAFESPVAFSEALAAKSVRDFR